VKSQLYHFVKQVMTNLMHMNSKGVANQCRIDCHHPWTYSAQL